MSSIEERVYYDDDYSSDTSMSEEEITAYHEAKNKIIAISDLLIKEQSGSDEGIEYDDPTPIKSYVPSIHHEYVDVNDHYDESYQITYITKRNFEMKHYSIKKSMPLKRFKYVNDLAHWVKQQGKIDDFKEWIRIPREKFRCLRTRLGYMFQPKDMEFKSILVKNLAPKTTGFQLREIFAQYGYVRDVYIPYNRFKSEPRNYGFVEIHFTTPYDQVIDEFSQFSILNGQSIKIQQAIMGRSTAEQMKARDDPV
jgi:hypothetical protein